MKALIPIILAVLAAPAFAQISFTDSATFTTGTVLAAYRLDIDHGFSVSGTVSITLTHVSGGTMEARIYDTEGLSTLAGTDTASFVGIGNGITTGSDNLSYTTPTYTGIHHYVVAVELTSGSTGSYQLDLTSPDFTGGTMTVGATAAVTSVENDVLIAAPGLAQIVVGPSADRALVSVTVSINFGTLPVDADIRLGVGALGGSAKAELRDSSNALVATATAPVDDAAISIGSVSGVSGAQSFVVEITPVGTTTFETTVPVVTLYWGAESFPPVSISSTVFGLPVATEESGCALGQTGGTLTPLLLLLLAILAIAQKYRKRANHPCGDCCVGHTQDYASTLCKTAVQLLPTHPGQAVAPS